MLVHVTGPDGRVSFDHRNVKKIHYHADSDMTMFVFGGQLQPLTAKGDWAMKIEKALTVGAVAVYRDRVQHRA